MRITRYKVVETQTVTDRDLEEIINEWVGEGWIFDGIQFAMRDSSKRPSMAFVVFTRTEHADAEGDDRADGAPSSETPEGGSTAE